MRYAVTLLVLISLAVVGCKPKQTGPVTTVEPEPTTLQPIPPADAAPATYPPPAPAAGTPAPGRFETVSSAAPAPAGNTYTVQKGDTLWSIAQRFLGDGHRWREIIDVNPGLDPDPSKLKVGQVIVLPPK
jgi:nucleoid-associated protein YgaU